MAHHFKRHFHQKIELRIILIVTAGNVESCKIDATDLTIFQLAHIPFSNYSVMNKKLHIIWLFQQYHFMRLFSHAECSLDNIVQNDHLFVACKYVKHVVVA